MDNNLKTWFPTGRVTVLDSRVEHVRAALSVCADLAMRYETARRPIEWVNLPDSPTKPRQRRGLYIANFYESGTSTEAIMHTLDWLADRYDSRILAVFMRGEGAPHVDVRPGYLVQPLQYGITAEHSGYWTLLPYWLDPDTDESTTALCFGLKAAPHDDLLADHDLDAVTWYGVVHLERSHESRQR